MTRTITLEMFRNAFLQQWKQDIYERKDEIYNRFSSSSDWTRFIQPKEGFLNRIMNRLPGNLTYKTEYYTIDSLYISGSDLLGGQALSYPSEIPVLIEHENGSAIEEEMWKLCYWRAPLKVIIFYDYNDDEKKNDSMKNIWLTGKISYLLDMLKEIDELHKENSETEYLFVIGARKVTNGEIYWRWASNRSPEPAFLTGS